MQIVIDIDEEGYNRIKILDELGISSDAIKIILKGIPLPKGHGRLIDADEIQFENTEFETYGDYCIAFDAIDQADTIIEADNAESEGKE